MLPLPEDLNTYKSRQKTTTQILTKQQQQTQTTARGPDTHAETGWGWGRGGGGTLAPSWCHGRQKELRACTFVHFMIECHGAELNMILPRPWPSLPQALFHAPISPLLLLSNFPQRLKTVSSRFIMIFQETLHADRRDFLLQRSF